MRNLETRRGLYDNAVNAPKLSEKAGIEMGFERNHDHLRQKIAGICSVGNMILPHSSPQLDTPMCSKQAWLGLTQISDNVAPDLRHSRNAWLGSDNDPKNHTTYECTQISGIIGMSPFSGVKEPLGNASACFFSRAHVRSLT